MLRFSLDVGRCAFGDETQKEFERLFREYATAQRDLILFFDKTVKNDFIIKHDAEQREE